MTALQCVMGYPRGWGDHSPHPPGTLPITLAADAGLMGLPIPAAITKAIDILKQRAEMPEKGKD